MTIKRVLYRSAIRVLEKWMNILPPCRICHLSLAPQEQKSVDIITIAFNNVELIKFQHRFLQRFVKDPYEHIIVDNSSSHEVREQLYAYCLEQGIAYISLPANHLNWVGPSYSHAAALNYMYHHVIQKRKPYIYGHIDHDLFLVKPISLAEKLNKQPIYGPLRDRNECWYLSAIFTFFKYAYVADKKVDYMPVTPYTTYLDSGGGNWYDIYSRLNKADIIFPSEKIEPLREGGDRHSDSLEWFDDKIWLHTINGSCWKSVTSGKDSLVRSYLQNLLNLTPREKQNEG